MKKDSVRFTVCIHKELFERLDYVSQFYGCSKSHELRRMIERELVQFERTYEPFQSATIISIYHNIDPACQKLQRG